jgi:hypothetical protein
MIAFYDRDDVRQCRAVIDRLQAELTPLQAEIDQIHCNPGRAFDDLKARRGEAVLAAAKRGDPLPDYTPQQLSTGQRLAALYRQRQSIQDALDAAKAEMESLQRKYSAVVRAEHEEEFKLLDAAYLEAGAEFVMAGEAIHNLNDRLQKAGYQVYFHSTLDNPLGRPRQRSDINYALRRAVESGVLTGKEPWLADFNHDGKHDQPAPKSPPDGKVRFSNLLINWRR